MGLELYNTVQCVVWASQTKTSLYKNANELSKEHPNMMRITGIGYGVASASITIALRVGQVGETIIKGFGNIFGAPFSDKCDCLKGLKQIFVLLPLSVLSLITSPLEGTLTILTHTLGMLYSPEWYSNTKKEGSADEAAIFNVLSSPYSLFPDDLPTKVTHFFCR